MQRSDSYRFFLTLILLLAAVFFLDLFASGDSATGHYVYEKRAEQDLKNSVKYETSFSLASLRERRQQLRAGYSRTQQLQQCDRQCGICEENTVCLPLYESNKDYGIPTYLRTCKCLPKPSD